MLNQFAFQPFSYGFYVEATSSCATEEKWTGLLALSCLDGIFPLKSHQSSGTHFWIMKTKSVLVGVSTFE
jgi:hypothetical protein